MRYRLPYPGALLQDLTARAGVSGSGRLLDLACGPGRVTLPLAPRFREAWGVDLEPEMIEVARREATRKGVTNVTWAVGRAEDFRTAVGSLDLITVGDAFHRLDEEAVAGLAAQWLRPGGCIAILGSGGFWRGSLPWQRVVADIIRRWAGDAAAPRDAGRAGLDAYIGFCERVLEGRGFIGVASHEFLQPHEWTADEIVGNLFSTSICSRRALGSGAESFDAEIRAALRALDPRDRYSEDTRFGYTFGRKPDSTGPFALVPQDGHG